MAGYAQDFEHRDPELLWDSNRTVYVTRRMNFRKKHPYACVTVEVGPRDYPIRIQPTFVPLSLVCHVKGARVREGCASTRYSGCLESSVTGQFRTIGGISFVYRLVCIQTGVGVCLCGDIIPQY